MSYEYKDEILDDIGPEPNSNYQIDSDRYYAKLKELDEIYAKAEAYDRQNDYMDFRIARLEHRGHKVNKSFIDELTTVKILDLSYTSDESEAE